MRVNENKQNAVCGLFAIVLSFYLFLMIEILMAN